MLKKVVYASLILMTSNLFAVQVLDLNQAPLSSIQQFSLSHTAKKAGVNKTAIDENTLQQIYQTKEANQTVIRYQQLYRGIPVVGAQAIVMRQQGISASAQSTVNGHLLNDIVIDTTPGIDSHQAIELAKHSFFAASTPSNTYQDSVQLQIRADEDAQLSLVYLVSFKTKNNEDKPVWPFFVVNAQTGEITTQWDNVKTLLDSGPGGNEKTHEYWYGKDGLPGLDVTAQGEQCVMEVPAVKLVNLTSAWDWNNLYTTAFQYPCNQNKEENINGAFSPVNDAYYFGNTIVDMYKNWYGLNALQLPNGNPMQLIMRVHFGKNYDNAFWDGESMSFGDGTNFYPLVSLDVAGHEVSHGFTEQHSNLEYHDESGAINESFSDMAGQASRAYLLETLPQLYGKAYLNPTQITWGIGETIIKGTESKALRFMDNPSLDGYSADCLDKKLANRNMGSCKISYPELLSFAKKNFPDIRDRQSFIVHTASGIFNKAFYLMSQKMGIKKTYQIMILANSQHWTPVTNFKQAACGVIFAAWQLDENMLLLHSIFHQVGIDTSACG
ncbi:MAG: M4 family metallopeptidase [Legionella sp.]|nr:M4 family metallopeptidase [Legionella sp.]